MENLNAKSVENKMDKNIDDLAKNSGKKNQKSRVQNSKSETGDAKNAQKIQNNKIIQTKSKNSLDEKGTKKLRKTSKKTKGHAAVMGLSVAVAVLGISTLTLGVCYGVSATQAYDYGIQLENIYKKNYFELVDNVNSTDTQISKLLASDSQTYQAKMLTEIAQSAKEMQNNIASLPLTGDNIVDSVRFINQISGYTQTLEEKISKGGALTDEELETLQSMHESLTEMKRYLNQMSTKMAAGYSILSASNTTSGDYDEFTLDFAQIKTEDADYPTMIYDGPFSDSVINQKIKGLSGSEVSRDEAYRVIDQTFKNMTNLKYSGQTAGRFDTYNFALTNSDAQNLYVQVTKIGGHILTVSGNVVSNSSEIDFEQAKKIALDFAKATGVEEPNVVWSQVLDGQTYLNIAPMQNGIVLYPDLVKVKIDMENGNVVGFDAISYWTNHTSRDLSGANISLESAQEQVDESFEIKNARLVLSPLDYNREVLCWEFECARDGATYYIYINASTGVEENILKVVETTDGSKLM